MAARKFPMAVLSTLPCLLLIAAQGTARAEGFLDLYGGATATRTADVRVSESTSSGTTYASASIDLSSPTEFGARFGAWFPTYNWIGLAMDMGYIRADGSGVDIDAFPFSLLVALRAPLFPTPDRPGGRLQPYAMAGVSFYIVDISAQVDGMGGSSLKGNWPILGGSDDKVWGPYLAAGLAGQLARNLAIFGEYRYTKFDVGFDTTNSIILPTMNGRVDTTVTSDTLLFGLSFRFGEKKSGAEISDHPPRQDE